MKRIVNKHPLAIRWFHWINFPILTIMIWSGLLIYWANDVYRLGWGNTTLVRFFPQSFYDALHIPFRLSMGMAFHFFFMWLFFLNGSLYVLYTLFSGEWRYLLPNRRSFKEAWLVLLHDLHIRRGLPPQDKYNAAQRIAYTAIIVMGFGSIVTGLAVYKPIQLNWLCALCGGYEAARIEHFALTIGYVLFFIIHVVQVIIAGWNNFQSMVTGFEVENIKEVPLAIPVIVEDGDVHVQHKGEDGSEDVIPVIGINTNEENKTIVTNEVPVEIPVVREDVKEESKEEGNENNALPVG